MHPDGNGYPTPANPTGTRLKWGGFGLKEKKRETAYHEKIKPTGSGGGGFGGAKPDPVNPQTRQTLVIPHSQIFQFPLILSRSHPGSSNHPTPDISLIPIASPHPLHIALPASLGPSSSPFPAGPPHRLSSCRYRAPSLRPLFLSPTPPPPPAPSVPQPDAAVALVCWSSSA